MRLVSNKTYRLKYNDILLSRIQNYNLESGTMIWKKSNIFSNLKTQTSYLVRIQFHSSNNRRDRRCQVRWELCTCSKKANFFARYLWKWTATMCMTLSSSTSRKTSSFSFSFHDLVIQYLQNYRFSAPDFSLFYR